MVSPHQPNLLDVDWSKIPAPADDGAAAHLVGMRVPDVTLQSTSGETIALGKLHGRTVLYAYPRTGTPGEISPVIEADYGFHILKVDARNDEALKPFDDVKPEIETKIQNDRFAAE